YEAYDRRRNVNGEPGDGREVLRIRKEPGIGMGGCDNHSYVDVINGGCKKCMANANCDRINGDKIHSGGNENKERVIKVGEEDINNEMIARSVVGEVKARCFLTKLPVLYEEQGLNNIEVKLLGGLEVLEVLENEETINNVLKDTKHAWIKAMVTQDKKRG
ncbi:hypothetical protein Tco_1495265, partial [Tanacetum coccineum]